MMHRFALLGLFNVAFLLSDEPAFALIPADVQVQKKFKDSAIVFIGSVSGLPTKASVEIKVENKLKGDGLPPMLRFRVARKDQIPLLEGIKVGMPAAGVAIVDNEKKPTSVLLHLNDMWLKASLETNPPQIDGKDDAMALGFPGRTATLVQILQDLAAGKNHLLNDELDYKDAKFASPKLVDLGSLSVKPTFVAAGRIDGKAALVVGTAQGMRLFLREGDGFKDATAGSGLAGKVASAAAFAELAGPDESRPGLVTPGETFALNAGKFDGLGANVGTAAADNVFAFGPASDTFMAALRTGKIAFGANGRVGPRIRLRGPVPFAPPADPILGGGFAMDANSASLPSLFVVTAKSIQFWSAGESANYADESAFTGIPKLDGKRAVVAAGIVDLNGDGRADLYVAFADGKDWAVLNRGYGCFFPHVNSVARRSEWKVGGRPAPAPAFVASADIDGDKAADILFVAADGRAFAWLNPLGRAGK